jgi:hypothetical protein
MRNKYRLSVIQAEGKRPRKRPRGRGAGNVKMDRQEMW